MIKLHTCLDTPYADSLAIKSPCGMLTKAFDRSIATVQGIGAKIRRVVKSGAGSCNQLYKQMANDSM